MRNSLIVGIVVALLLGLMGSVYVVREGQVTVPGWRRLASRSPRGVVRQRQAPIFFA